MDLSIEEQALAAAIGASVGLDPKAWNVEAEAVSTLAELHALGLHIVEIPSEPLPDVAHARRSDPATSEIAAASISDMKERHRAVLSVASAFSEPFTYDDLIYRYNEQRNRYGDLPKMEPQSIRSRCAELRRAGWVYPTGEKGVSDAGRPAILWKAARR